MIPAVRRQTILDILTSSESILYIENLVDILDVSSSTLRRDLRELEKEGKVVLLHGGGVQLRSEPSHELSISSKIPLYHHEKVMIAKKACEYINDGDTIFLDPSSTTLEMIPFLKSKDITVITNGIYHINLLVQNLIPSIMIGGNIKIATNSCIGPIAETALNSFHFNKCFLGSNGFSIPTGITNHDINECSIKQIAMKNSTKSFFLLDSSKYGLTTMVKVTDIDYPTIITDKHIPSLKNYKNIIIA